MHATEPHGGVVVWIQMREWQYISRNAHVPTTAGGKATVSRFPLENVTNEGNFKKFLLEFVSSDYINNML